MPRLLFAVKTCRRGATAVEYGLIVALIVIAMMASFASLAKNMTDLWNTISIKVATAN